MSYSSKMAEGEIEVVALMGGVIMDLNVRVGDKVSEGDLLASLEIMKMETEVYAPVAGVIRSINVSAGQEIGIEETIMTIKHTKRSEEGSRGGAEEAE